MKYNRALHNRQKIKKSNEELKEICEKCRKHFTGQVCEQCEYGYIIDETEIEEEEDKHNNDYRNELKEVPLANSEELASEDNLGEFPKETKDELDLYCFKSEGTEKWGEIWTMTIEYRNEKKMRIALKYYIKEQIQEMEKRIKEISNEIIVTEEDQKRINKQTYIIKEEIKKIKRAQVYKIKYENGVLTRTLTNLNKGGAIWL